MHHFSKLRVVLFAVSSIITANVARSLQPRQCSEPNIGNVIAKELQTKFWNTSSGSYMGGELWTDANALEDLHDLMLLTSSNAYGVIADNSYIGRAALNSSTDWDLFFGGSYDDAQWVILALWKIIDYKASRGQDYSRYMSSSLAIYSMVAAQWDGVCGGGIWWSSDHTYKNAITNELFLLTSAEAYIRTRNRIYLENALKEYEWLLNSGMQGPDGLFNDGLNLDTCKNNGATAWTYNQAVVASGLGALYVADGCSNETFLEQAQVSLDATIRLLTSGNILKESCDDNAPSPSPCDNDQKLFKVRPNAEPQPPLDELDTRGIWMKHVQYFLDSARDASITSKYGHFLAAQNAAIRCNALNATNDVGSVWYAPDEGGSLWGPQSSTSGLEAVISAAKYATCL